MDYQIDKLDRDILHILMSDATTPFSEIAKKLIVSNGTVHVRVGKMKAAGIISGSSFTINAQKLGYDICAFIGVFLEKGSFYHDVADSLKKIDEIVELHYTTGGYSLFLKIQCKDTAGLRELLSEKIQKVKGIQRTETIISLEEGFRREVNIR